MIVRALVAMLSLILVSACGGDQKAKNANGGDDGDKELLADGGRCNVNRERIEVSEYDTSGDNHPDVRKVFLTLGKGRLTRLILICREADLNGDGRKDVFRFYDDEGSPEREEQDRNFDGKLDQIQHFEDGHVALRELDENGDGLVDSKTWFENGGPSRTERDMAGRSTKDKWHPDRWEYFEKGRVVRVGTDLDGDSRVDRWDRAT